MTKKILFFVTLIIIFTVSAKILAEEQIKLISYYPAPFGAYRQMTVGPGVIFPAPIPPPPSEPPPGPSITIKEYYTLMRIGVTDVTVPVGKIYIPATVEINGIAKSTDDPNDPNDQNYLPTDFGLYSEGTVGICGVSFSDQQPAIVGYKPPKSDGSLCNAPAIIGTGSSIGVEGSVANCSTDGATGVRGYFSGGGIGGIYNNYKYCGVKGEAHLEEYYPESYTTPTLVKKNGKAIGGYFYGDTNGIECSSSLSTDAQAICVTGGWGGILINDTSYYGLKIDTNAGNGIESKSPIEAIWAETTNPSGEWAGLFNGHIYVRNYPSSEHDGGDIWYTGELHNESKGDISEIFELSEEEEITSGDVVIVDYKNSATLKRCTEAYDIRVAGIISSEDQAAAIFGKREDGSSDRPLALAGKVYCKVDASYGAIRPGDLLTTSPTTGYAMKAKQVDIGGVRIYRPGTIVGKALEPLKKGKSKILVLVCLM